MFLAIATSFVLFVQCFCGVPWVGEAKDENWMNHHRSLINQTVTHHSDIQLVFLGDSITFGWLGFGKAIWNEYYAKPRHAYNYGIGGDRTENVIYRIENREFDGIKPKAVILMIGTNNLHTANSAEDIGKGISKIRDLLEAKLPTTKLLILGVLPEHGTLSVKVQAINKISAGMADKKKVFFLDMSSHFLSGGKQVMELYNDSVHPNAKGYDIWHKAMEPLLKQLLGEH